jgi:hypothetical protein
MKNFACLIKANVNKTSVKKKLSKYYSKHSKLWSQYRNRVKIISLIETDVSEATMATQLGFPKS